MSQKIRGAIAQVRLELLFERFGYHQVARREFRRFYPQKPIGIVIHAESPIAEKVCDARTRHKLEPWIRRSVARASTRSPAEYLIGFENNDPGAFFRAGAEQIYAFRGTHSEVKNDVRVLDV